MSHPTAHRRGYQAPEEGRPQSQRCKNIKPRESHHLCFTNLVTKLVCVDRHCRMAQKLGNKGGIVEDMR